MIRALLISALLFCAVAIQPCAAALARADEAAKKFEAGRRAYEAQALEDALAAFDASVAAGMSGPAVHYNIGVTAYRLGLLDRAERAFLEVARVPDWAALAHYNLGLVALRREDRVAAGRWFNLAFDSATDEGLRDLAASQLDRLLQPPPARRWSGFAMLVAGRDDNVALLADTAPIGVSGREDEFAEVRLAVSGPLEGSWRFDAAAVHVDYFDLDEFDQSAVSLGAARRLLTGSWHSDVGAQANFLTLDGEMFERTAALVAQTAAPVYPEWWLRARYRASRVEGFEAFEGLTGTRHELGARLDWRRADWRLGIDCSFDDSNSDEEVFASTWYQLGVELRWEPHDSDWSLALEAAQRRTRHDGEPDEDTGTGRREDRTRLGASAAMRIGASIRVVARYEHYRNDADLLGFDYDRNRVYLGVEFVR